MIITANKWFNETWEKYKIGILIPSMIKHGILTEPKISEGKPINVFVNHGRWCAKCECGGSEYVWEEGLFMCQSCWNSAHKHNFRQSVFPENRRAVEQLLNVRPLVNRNWNIGETIDNLKAENAEHKAELLEVS